MQITDGKKLKEVQAEFRETFPCLKLEFYEGKHESGQPSPAREQYDAEKTIGEIRTVHKEGNLDIAGHTTVNALEDHFWKDYGLNVQVFRRSGNLWLQTSTTGNWTLAEQNRKGERSEQAYKEMHGDEGL